MVQPQQRLHWRRKGSCGWTFLERKVTKTAGAGAEAAAERNGHDEKDGEKVQEGLQGGRQRPLRWQRSHQYRGKFLRRVGFSGRPNFHKKDCGNTSGVLPEAFRSPNAKAPLEDANAACAGGRGGAGLQTQSRDPAPPVAATRADNTEPGAPSQPGSVHALRALKTLATAVDEIVRDRPRHAADLLWQRSNKAIETSLADNSQNRARFLELLPRAADQKAMACQGRPDSPRRGERGRQREGSREREAEVRGLRRLARGERTPEGLGQSTRRRHTRQEAQ